MVVMAFDEEGQAADRDRKVLHLLVLLILLLLSLCYDYIRYPTSIPKVEICQRSFKILVERAGVNPQVLFSQSSSCS